MSNMENGIGEQALQLNKVGKGMKQALSYTKNVGVMTLALLANEPAKSEITDGDIPVNTAVSGFWYSPVALVGGDMHSNRSLNFSFASLPNGNDPDQTRNIMFFNTFTPSANTSFGAPVATSEGYTPNFTGQCDATTAKISGCDWVDDPEGKYTIPFDAVGLKDCDPEAFMDKNLPRNCAVDGIGDFQVQFPSCDVMTIKENIVDINTGDVSTITYNMVSLLSEIQNCEIMTNTNIPATVDILTATGIANLDKENGLSIEITSFEPDEFDENGNPVPAVEHPLLKDHWKLNIVSGSVKIDGVPLPAGKGIELTVEDFQAPYFWSINFKGRADLSDYLQRGQTMTLNTFYIREGSDGQSLRARTEDRTLTVTWQ